MFSIILSFLGNIKNYLLIGAGIFLLTTLFLQKCELNKLEKKYEEIKKNFDALEANIKQAETISKLQEENYKRIVNQKNAELKKKFDSLIIDNTTIEKIKLSNKYIGENQ